MAVGALFVGLGKVAGAVKEMAVAWRYGVNEVVDAYLFVFNLLSWPIAVWFSVLVVVLVPLAAGVRERNPSELPRFRAELLGLTLLLGLSLLVLAEFGMSAFLRSSASGLSSTALKHAMDIAPALSWIVFLGMPISLFSAWMMAAQRHTNTLMEGIPALLILVAVLLIPGTGPEALIWGTLAGFAFHLAGLSASLATRQQLESPRFFTLQSPCWNLFWRGFGIMLAAQLLMSFGTIIDQLFAARLNAGAIATLSYANRIVALVLGLGATAVSRATLPVFSEAHAQQSSNVRRVALRWVQLLFGLGVAALACGWLLAPWTVRVLFERGAFTGRDTQAVTEVLRYALFQVPFYFASLVLVNLVTSRHNYTTLVGLSVVGLAVKLLGNAVLVPRMAINGLVLSNALVYASTCVLLAIAVKKTNSPAVN